jgi:alpha-beta hydrolase superfamily lysophospholipase
MTEQQAENAPAPVAQELPPEVQALHRAMPMTRLLDCGMDYADACALYVDSSHGMAWDQAAERLAQAQLARAEEALRAGRYVTARQAFKFAAASFVFAQMAFNFDVPRKRELYDLFTSAVARAGALYRPPIERVEIPFASGRLVGWLVLPESGQASATVIILGGQSGWGATYLPIADALAQRGMAALLAEGPGQGETRLKYGIYLDGDVASALSRFVDHIRADARLGEAVGIWGNSFGGLFAARAAAHDQRLRACCINGAPATPTLPPFRAALEQAAAMQGTNDQERLQSNYAQLQFDPSQHTITCPVLMLHGGRDPLVTLAQQRIFLEGTSHPNATLRVWEDGEHTIYNHSAERTAFVADWFAEQLLTQ